MAVDGTVTIAVQMEDGSVRKGVADLNGQLQSLNAPAEQAGSSLKNALSLGAIGGLAYQAVGMVVDGVKQLAGEAISSSDSMDKFKSTMGFAGFSTANIDKAGASVKKYADETVYDLGTVANTTAQLAANGVKDYTGLTEAAGNLNAVAGGNADTFGSVAMVMTQTAGAGKLTTENWNQLADAIPGASGKLQEAMKQNGAFTGNFREAMENGEITADEFNQAIMQLGNQPVAVEAAKSTTTFEGAVGNLQATVVTGLTDIINRFKGDLTGAISTFASFAETAFDKVGDAIEFVIKHADEMKAVAVGVMTLVTAFKALMIINAIRQAMEGYTIATKAAVLWQKLMNTAFMANPIGLVIVAVTALVAALVYFFTQTKTGRQMWQNFMTWLKNTWQAIVTWATTLWTSLSTFFTNLWNGIKTTATNLWNGIKTSLTNIWNSAVTTVKNVWNGVKTFLGNLWNTIRSVAVAAWNATAGRVIATIMPLINAIKANFTNAKNTLTTIWNNIKTIASNAWTLIKNVVLAPVLLLINLVTGDFKGMRTAITQIWNNIRTAASNIWNAMRNIVVSLVNGVVTSVRNLWNGLVGTLSNMWNNLRNNASAVWNAIKDTVSNLVRGAVDTVRNIWNAIPGFLSGLWNGLIGLASGAWNGILNTITSLASGAVNGLKNIWGNIKDWVAGVFNGIKDTISKAMDIDLYQVGKNILDGLINGIEGAVDSVVKAARNVAESIKDRIKKTLGIHSPSRVMRDEVGRFIPEGLAIGIEKYTGVAEKAMAGMSDKLQTAIAEPTLDMGVSGGLTAAKNIISHQFSGQASQQAAGVTQEVNINQDITVRENPSERELRRQTNLAMKQAAYQLAGGI